MKKNLNFSYIKTNDFIGCSLDEGGDDAGGGLAFVAMRIVFAATIAVLFMLFSCAELEFNEPNDMNGTAYGPMESSSSSEANPSSSSSESPPDFVDGRDGKTYKTFGFGGKTWFAQNLNHTPADGGNYACYGNESGNCGIYGALYDWETASSSCPDGWRLPTDSEWSALAEAYSQSAAEREKFNAVFGGIGAGAEFYDIGAIGIWWSSTADDEETAAFVYEMESEKDDVLKQNSYDARIHFFSVRCLKDN